MNQDASSTGVLMCCDHCPRAFHQTCMGFAMHSVADPWKCPMCTSCETIAHLYYLLQQHDLKWVCLWQILDACELTRCIIIWAHNYETHLCKWKHLWHTHTHAHSLSLSLTHTHTYVRICICIYIHIAHTHRSVVQLEDRIVTDAVLVSTFSGHDSSAAAALYGVLAYAYEM